MNVADTDGGAHVDPSLDIKYLNLSRFNSLNWNFVGADGIDKQFANNPVFPSVRQISHELTKTLLDEFPMLNGLYSKEISELRQNKLP